MRNVRRRSDADVIGSRSTRTLIGASRGAGHTATLARLASIHGGNTTTIINPTTGSAVDPIEESSGPPVSLGDSTVQVTIVPSVSGRWGIVWTAPATFPAGSPDPWILTIEGGGLVPVPENLDSKSGLATVAADAILRGSTEVELLAGVSYSPDLVASFNASFPPTDCSLTIKATYLGAAA